MERRLGPPGSKRVQLVLRSIYSPVHPGDTSLDLDTDEALHILQSLRKHSVSLHVHLPGLHGALGSVSENESPAGLFTLSRDVSWIWDLCCQMPADSREALDVQGLVQLLHPQCD